MNKLLYFIKSHAEDILAITAGALVVATGISSYKAGQSEDKKAVIPPIIFGTGSVACIAGCRAISKRRQASLMAAGALMAESYNAYVKSVDMVVDKNIPIIRPEPSEIEDTGTGDIIFIEDFTGRRFKASKEHVYNAFEKFIQKYADEEHVNLNDLYALLNISTTMSGDMIGWSYSSGRHFENYSQIDFEDAAYNLGIVIEDYPGLGTVIRYTNIPDYYCYW